MLNQFVVVGRIKNIVKEEVEEKEVVTLELGVPRSFKNINGEYDTDLVEIMLIKGIAKNTLEFCKPGDLVGAKGTIRKLENDNKMSLVAEKITFLSSKPKED